jgi:hypothetical protein
MNKFGENVKGESSIFKTQNSPRRRQHRHPGWLQNGHVRIKRFAETMRIVLFVEKRLLMVVGIDELNAWRQRTFAGCQRLGERGITLVVGSGNEWCLQT